MSAGADRARAVRSTAKPPRFYFSFRSPYSWLAWRDLRERHAQVATMLEWIPFWEPDAQSQHLLTEAGGAFLYTPMSRAKHLYILQDVARLAAERGTAICWPVDRHPTWEVPHLAYLVAARHDRGHEFVERTYRARWEEGRDICDRGTISQIARYIGLDTDELADASDDPDTRRQGVDALMAAYRDGVFGVPFFVHGIAKFWGLDRLETFVASLRVPASKQDMADRQPREFADEPVPAESTDAGHAGGCG